MSCFSFRSARSKEIDSQIKAHQREEKFNLRILMLGTSASGKSTFAKQLKILHCKGFTEDELENYKQILVLNIFNGLKELVFQAEQLNIKIRKKNRPIAKYFLDVNSYTEKLTEGAAQKAKLLWKDKGIQEIWSNRNLIDFHINLEYMIENIDRFVIEGYVPTNMDVLHTRQRTTGVAETRFQIDQYKWTVVDVGGQRSERKKWLHFFEDSTAIIYCASLVEYDMVVPEDNSKNKMLESLEIFESVTSGEWCANKVFILFLNKIDLFKTKVKTSPIKEWFPEYEGTTYKEGLEYIKSLYLKRSFNIASSNLKVHLSCALDTKDVDYVFRAVFKNVVKERLQRSGVL